MDDATTWLINNRNTHINQHLKKYSKSNQAMKFGQSTEHSMRNIFSEKL